MATKNFQAKPAIVSRSSWGARSTQCTTTLSGITALAVHHCASNNDSVNSRTPSDHQKWLQDYHMDSRAFCDLGYHFGVGKDGTLLEGRPSNLMGAHVGGHNSYTLGVVTHGDYTSRALTSTQENKMVDLLSWLCYSYDVEPADILGHKEFSNTSTSCPASIMNQMTRIRNRVSDRLYGSSGGPI